MKSLVLFPVVLFSACVASTSSRYEQAAAPVSRPVPWTRTYTSPPGHSHVPAGAGASAGHTPTMGQTSVPRSTNWRLSGEHPEIMAPDGARATVTPLESRKLLTSYLPDLKGVPNAGEFAALCASEMTRALAELPPGLMDAVEDGEMEASFAQMPCLAAWLYQVCAERHLPARLNEPGVKVELALKDAYETAEARCGKKGDTLAVRTVLAAVRRSRSHLH